jgi:hypothetical protein
LPKSGKTLRIYFPLCKTFGKAASDTLRQQGLGEK